MRIGDETSGFSVDPEQGTLRVRAWGFWSADTARSFDVAVVNACAEMRFVSRLIFDMTELKPMREEGQAAFARLLEALAGLRIAKVSILTSSALTRLQLLRLATEKGAAGRIEFAMMPEQLGRT